MFVVCLKCVLVAESYLTLGDPRDSSPPSSLSMAEFSRQENWNGLPFPSPGHLPDPGIKPSSPTLQADSLPSEPPGKPHFILFYFIIFSFTFISWRLITSQYCSGSCHTLM